MRLRTPSPKRYAFVTRRLCAAAALAVAAGCYGAQPAVSASRSGLIVMPHPTSHPGLSYFKVSARPGSAVRAGTIELRNPTNRRLRAVLAVVDGETLSTLGSSYSPPGSHPHGSALWLHLGRRSVTLAPGAGVAVPVSLIVPAGAPAGDHLSGVSIEALEQHAQTVRRRGVAIASISRYAIGAEVSLPGPRKRLIKFTGATLKREPAGLTFALLARNSGNTILQGVHGHVTIKRAGRTVVSRPIEAGTFVAHTGIAYPVTAFRQTPPEGTHYRVSAWMRYPGGIARLNTTLTFGHRAAVAQQQYGGPSAGGGGTAWWKIAGVLAVILYGVVTTALLLRRRIQGPRASVQQ
jgi:hypothetical protein